MIDAGLSAELLDLAHHVAPELRLVNLYFVDAADLQRVEPSNCYGYCDRGVDPVVRDHLIAGGQWQGQGNLVVFQTDAIRADASNFHRAMIEVFAHELAHLLPAFATPLPVDNEPSTREREVFARRHLDFATHNDSNVVTSDHGSRFIRCACHVWFRLLAMGLALPAHQMFAGYRWGLSPALEYYEALHGEPFRMAGELFSRIEAAPIHSDFTNLWQSDLEKINDNA